MALTRTQTLGIGRDKRRSEEEILSWSASALKVKTS